MYLNINTRRSLLTSSSLIDARRRYLLTRLIIAFFWFFFFLLFFISLGPTILSFFSPVLFSAGKTFPEETFPRGRYVHNAHHSDSLYNILSCLCTYCFPFLRPLRCNANSRFIWLGSRGSDRGVLADLWSRDARVCCSGISVSLLYVLIGKRRKSF